MNTIAEKIVEAPAAIKYGVAAGLAALAMSGGLKAASANAEAPLTPDQAALQDRCVTEALYSFEGSSVGYVRGSNRVVYHDIEAEALSGECAGVVERNLYAQQWLGKKPSRLHPNTEALLIEGNQEIDTRRKQISWIRWNCKKFFGQVVTVQAESPSGEVLGGKQFKSRLAKPSC